MSETLPGDDIKLMLVRLESKVDTVLARHEIRLDQHDTSHTDHEHRLRSLEVAIHQLATKTDIEDIERKRDSEQAARQRKMLSWVTLAFAVVIPVETAVIALVVQAFQN